jgi:arylsulfatase A-like enzyme
VDLAPTILGLAGIEATALDHGPFRIDGQSVVPLLIDPAEAAKAPASVRRHLAAATAPVRDTAFTEYYNQGQWKVAGRYLDDWSNTYIGVTFRNATRSWKYAEYDPYGKQSNFSSVYFTELFDLIADPYELRNIYNESSAELKALLHAKTRNWFECAGATCVDTI